MPTAKKVVHTFVINEWHICVSLLWTSIAFLVLQWLRLDSEVVFLKSQIQRLEKEAPGSCSRKCMYGARGQSLVSTQGHDRHFGHNQHDKVPLPGERPMPNGLAESHSAGKPDPVQYQGHPRAFNYHSPGEWGTPVITDPAYMNPADREMMEDGIKRHSFNVFASDLISVRRSLPDVAGPKCRERASTYRTDLPEVGVVIIFHNEAWSTLIRTVHSVIDRTPPHLLKEIILVDDFSDLDDLKERLDDYTAALDKVRVIRASSRQGLIRARLLGFDDVTADVAMFLDAHCECTDGWLEPLLDRIARDPTTVAVPVADRIKFDTMEYQPGNGSEMFCGFEWDMTFNWIKLPERERIRRKDVLDPIRSPTFLGCCFAIDVKFFNSIGRYDTGFNIWGAEHLELAFKTWMCGGKLEIVPCSHVGHLFREKLPFSFPSRTVGDTVRRNNARLVEVWLSDYKHFFYDRIFYEKIDIGNITERIEIREEQKCRSFDWYLENVYPELYIPYDCTATGQIKLNRRGEELCVQSSQAWFLKGEITVTARHCSTDIPPQHWTLTRESQIRQDQSCLTVDQKGHTVIIAFCQELRENGTWKYREDNRIVHEQTGRCMTVSLGSNLLVAAPCSDDPSQAWYWERRTLKLKTRP